MPPILLAVDKTYPKGLMWFRRDLRVDDNAALYRALRACRQVVCVFVFDKAILDALPTVDRRVEFIRESLVELEAELRALGGGLVVRHAAAVQEIPALARELGVQAVFANRDDEPDALERDAKVFGALANAGVAFHTYKDSTVFDRDEVMTKTDQPYTVFTPYKRAWLAKVDAFFLKSYPVRSHADALAPSPQAYGEPVPTLREIGFEKSNLSALEIPPARAARACCSRISSSASTATTRRATSLRCAGPATWACTCASARCRSGRWPAWRTSSRCRATPGRRPG